MNDRIHKWTNLVQGIMAWLSLGDVVGIVVEVKEPQDESEAVSLDDVREGVVSKRPGSHPVIFNGWIVDDTHDYDQGEELLQLSKVKR